MHPSLRREHNTNSWIQKSRHEGSVKDFTDKLRVCSRFPHCYNNLVEQVMRSRCATLSLNRLRCCFTPTEGLSTVHEADATSNAPIRLHRRKLEVLESSQIFRFHLNAASFPSQSKLVGNWSLCITSGCGCVSLCDRLLQILKQITQMCRTAWKTCRLHDHKQIDDFLSTLGPLHTPYVTRFSSAVISSW